MQSGSNKGTQCRAHGTIKPRYHLSVVLCISLPRSSQLKKVRLPAVGVIVLCGALGLSRYGVCEDAEAACCARSFWPMSGVFVEGVFGFREWARVGSTFSIFRAPLEISAAVCLHLCCRPPHVVQSERGDGMKREREQARRREHEEETARVIETIDNLRV